MKATIELPDELYRRVKAKSALLGRPVREVTADLYRRWLSEDVGGRPAVSPQDWLDDWLALADEALKDASGGRTAREILADDRNRLEPK